MTAFRQVTEGKTIDLKHKYSDKIVLLFDKLSNEYFKTIKESRKPRTNLIKYNLVKLGHILGYRVYANGLTKEQLEEQKEKYDFINREFLFDIHWYTDKSNEHYMPETLSLVAESEIGDRRKGDKSKIKNPAVMFDFQKLLVTNAEIRLLIFKTKNLKELNALDSYFEKSIETYKHLEKKSAFLFLCFEHQTKSLYYTEKFKK